MAWGEKRPNGRFRGGWRDTQGDKHYTPEQYLTRRDAELAAWIEEDSTRRRSPHRNGELTWGQWSQQWLGPRRRAVAVGTFANDERAIRRHLEPRWGEVALVRITGRDVRAWVQQLLDDGNGRTATAKALFTFSASLRDAVAADLIDINPAHGAGVGDSADFRERFFTRAEIDSITSWMNPPYGQAVCLLCATGLRFGELAGLHWQHVDLEHGRIDVQVAWSRDAQAMTPTKGRNRRSVPILAEARDVLDAIAVDDGTCGRPHVDTARCRSGLVLAGPDGAPLDSKNMRERHWKPALEIVGLKDGRQHDLRHTFASWAIQRGVSLSDVAEALGHSDAVVTRRYAHIAGTHLGRIREAFDGPPASESVSAAPKADDPDVIDLEGRRRRPRRSIR